MKDSEVHYRQELMQTLSIRDLVVYGMLYMLPIAPFGMFGLLAKPTHGLVPLAYCFSFIAVIFTARSYMIFSNAFPVAGSVYTYTRIGINDLAGFFGGWVVFLDYVLAPGLMAVVSAAAMNDLLPLVPRWGWILIFLGLGTGMNLVGVNLTAKANRWMLAAMLVVLAVFLWVGLHALYFEGKGDGGLTFRSFYDPHLFTWPGMASGVLIGATSFLGFDAISTLGEEVRPDQKRLIGLAGPLTLVVICAIFVLQAWVAADLAPKAVVHSSDSEFYDIARYAGGPALSAMASIASALAFGVCCTIVCQSAVSRIIYAMARDRQLPHLLARVHPKTKQPYVANIMVAAISLGIALWFQDHLAELFLFQNFGALCAFTLVNASLIMHYWVRSRSRRVLSHLICPAIGGAISLTLLASMRQATLELGVGWIMLGIVYYAAMRYGLGRSVAIQV